MVPELSAKDKREILEEARSRFADVLDRDQTNRKWQRDDTRFVYEPGAQWPAEFKNNRTTEDGSDPCLEFNQLKQFVNQVVNDQRQNRPGIRVHPAGGEASEETAETAQGLIRAIEYDSQAEAVYDCGYQHSVVGGRGYWRVVSEYESADSFNQKLVIQRIPDPLSVVPDIDFRAPDASDMNFCFVMDVMKRDEFKRKYPKARIGSWTTDGDCAEWFRGEDEVIVADYYRRVCRPRTLALLADGSTVWKDGVLEGAKIINERESEDYAVEWYTLGGGQEILEQHEWPGTIIPVVMDMGDEIVVEGKRMFQGLIRMARDSQALFNFAMTAQAIHLGNAPRAPYIMAEGQAEGYEALWREANRKNFAYLYYKPTMVDGQLAPPPQRQAPSMPDAGLMSASQQATQLLRSTIGMYENSLGLHGQETSGRAIIAREKQGDNATFHYADNHARAIALTGRIVLEVLPVFYDTERAEHIIGEDDERKAVVINQQQIDPATQQPVVKNDFSIGKYDVAVSSGPTYATRKQEGADLLMQMVQAVPEVMKVAGDLVMKAQEVPDAEILAERFKLLLPPPIQQAEAAKAAGADPKLAQMNAQLQQVTQQAQQAIQQLNGQLQQVTQELQQVKADKTAQIQANQAKAEEAHIGAQIEAQKLQTDVALAQQQAQLEREKLEFEREKIEFEREKMNAELMKVGVILPPPEQAARQEVQGVTIAAIQSLAQQFSAVAQALAAPRETKLVHGPDGRPVGSVSQPIGVQ